MPQQQYSRTDERIIIIRGLNLGLRYLNSTKTLRIYVMPTYHVSVMKRLDQIKRIAKICVQQETSYESENKRFKAIQTAQKHYANVPSSSFAIDPNPPKVKLKQPAINSKHSLATSQIITTLKLNHGFHSFCHSCSSRRQRHSTLGDSNPLNVNYLTLSRKQYK